MAAIAQAWAAFLVVGCGLVCAPLAKGDAGPAKSAPGYRITGIAVSSRDGAPIPFCHLDAQFSAQAQGAGTGEDRRVRPGRGGDGAGGRGAGRDAGRGGAGQQPGAFRGQFAARAVTNTNPEALADAGGHFVLEVPRAGAWRLGGTARGFREQNYDEHEGFYSDVVLTSTAPVLDVTFRLEPDAAISGLVLDEAGEPVRSAPVFVELLPVPLPSDPVPAARQVGFGATDDRGRYEVDGLASGDYRVKVQAQPWYTRGVRVQGSPNGGPVGNPATSAISTDPPLDVVYGTVYYPGTQDEAAAGIVQLRGGEERQADFSLVAVPAARLEVPRVDLPAASDGRPRPLRGISISKVSPEGYAQSTALTNGTMWEFGGLSAGTYEVRTQGAEGDPDGEVRQVVIAPGAAGVVTMEGAKALTRITIGIDGVSQDQANGVTFIDLVSGRRIDSRGGTGRPDRMGGGLQGSSRRPREESPGPRTVLVPPSRYEVLLSGSENQFLTGLTAKGAQVAGRQIEVGEGEVQLTLHVASGKSELAGFARLSASQEAAAGAMILLVPVTLGEPGNLSDIRRDETNTDGSFDLHGVIPGRYILLAIDHGWGTNWRDPVTLAAHLAHGVAIDLLSSSKISKEIVAQAP